MVVERSRRIIPGGGMLVGVIVLGLLLGGDRAATGRATATGAATPAAPRSASAGDLASLLRLAPDRPVGSATPVQIAAYADIAGQLRAVGIERPTTIEGDGWTRYAAATRHLVLPPDLALHAADPAWREAFGFEALQVDQALHLGDPPYLTTLLRGRFDERELRAAWQRTGYRPVATDLPGATAASLAAEPRVDLDSPIVRLAINSMNNAAILPDGSLAFSSSLAGLRAVLAVAAGRAPSLADRPAVASLVRTSSDVVSAVIVEGSVLRRTIPSEGLLTPTPSGGDAVATESAGANRMPPVRLALVGVTPGGPVPADRLDPAVTPTTPDPTEPRARLLVVLRFGDRGAAVAAAPIVRERLALGRSRLVERGFAEFFPTAEQRVDVVRGGPVLVADLGIGANVSLGIGFDMLFAGDLGFAAW